LLIDNKADVYLCNGIDQDALGFAARNGRVDCALMLLGAMRVSVQQPTFALDTAAARGHVALVQQVLLYYPHAQRERALRSAAAHADCVLLRALLTGVPRGTRLDVNAALCSAASSANLDVLELLLDSVVDGAKQDQSDDDVCDHNDDDDENAQFARLELDAAVRAAAGAGFVGGLRALLARGADPWRRTTRGTSLHVAVESQWNSCFGLFFYSTHHRVVVVVVIGGMRGLPEAERQVRAAACVDTLLAHRAATIGATARSLHIALTTRNDAGQTPLTLAICCKLGESEGEGAGEMIYALCFCW
jgi:hypothetical protein